MSIPTYRFSIERLVPRIGLSVMVAGFPLAACDLCVLPDLPDSRPASEGLSLGLATKWSHFGTVQDGERVLSDLADQYLDSAMIRLQAAWRFSGPFSLRGDLPYIHRRYRAAEGMEIETGSVSGLGDFALSLDATVLAREGADWSLHVTGTGGVELPTGSSEHLDDEGHHLMMPGDPVGGVHGHDLALGSGSWDVLLGVGVAGTWHDWFASAALRYAFRTEGAYTYRFGDDVTTALGVGHLLIGSGARRLGLALVATGEWKAKDRHHDEVEEGTGMAGITLGPEVSLTWGEGLQALLALDLPAYEHTTGPQVVLDWRLRAGANVAF